MNAMNLRRCWLIPLALLALAFLPACSANLFNDSTTSHESNIDRYWDGDSAIRTTESRRKSSEMGFGYPSGASSQ